MPSLKHLLLLGPGSKPESSKQPPCMWAWCTLRLASWVKRPPAGVGRSYGESSRDFFVTTYPAGKGYKCRPTQRGINLFGVLFALQVGQLLEAERYCSCCCCSYQ
ncbi:hypothetical protein AVEN_3608-1 [Araneus ventricosus]|uniref:Uncharacterized protein n=1 Tax=Araneus ventricosus TaxID=182803 RepID=A0A4Y2X2T8_ARAVE|nr:hypothetical protein AVEN_3608-1 [Araneus ventricosus]